MHQSPRLFELIASDESKLSAAIFETSEPILGSILLCPGLGIPKELYFKYAGFLCGQGYNCLVFDYRGIGRVAGIKGEINLRNWGLIDMPSCLDWLHQAYPLNKIYFFGHSIAGQIAGLMPNHQIVERFVFFCSTGGYFRVFDFPLCVFTWFMFNVHIPLALTFFGHLPKGLTYRGVDIARGVASEWAQWSRKRDYISAFFGKTLVSPHYDKIQAKIDWIYFEDDKIATNRAIESVKKYYKSADITLHKISPFEKGLKEIGHAGFFLSKSRSIWSIPLNFIKERSK